MKSILNFALELDAIILGLAIQNSIEILVDSFSGITFVLFITSFSMNLNFFYAKMLEITKNKQIGINNIFDFIIHILPLLFLSLISSSINNLKYFILFNILLRACDILEIFVFIIIKNNKISRMYISWFVTDIIVYVYLIVFFVDLMISNNLSEQTIAISLMLLWFVDAYIDYRLQKKFYFDIKR